MGEWGDKNSPRAVLLVAVVVVEGGGDDERKRSKRRRRTAIEGFEVFHHLHPFPSKYRTPPKKKKIIIKESQTSITERRSAHPWRSRVRPAVRSLPFPPLAVR